jgi:hypothetical protein
MSVNNVRQLLEDGAREVQNINLISILRGGVSGGGHDNCPKSNHRSTVHGQDCI